MILMAGSRRDLACEPAGRSADSRRFSDLRYELLWSISYLLNFLHESLLRDNPDDFIREKEKFPKNLDTKNCFLYSDFARGILFDAYFKYKLVEIKIMKIWKMPCTVFI